MARSASGMPARCLALESRAAAASSELSSSGRCIIVPRNATVKYSSTSTFSTQKYKNDILFCCVFAAFRWAANQGLRRSCVDGSSPPPGRSLQFLLKRQSMPSAVASEEGKRPAGRGRDLRSTRFVSAFGTDTKTRKRQRGKRPRHAKRQQKSRTRTARKAPPVYKIARMRCCMASQVVAQRES